MFFSKEPNRIQPTNYVEICNSTFVENMAKYGSAIQANKEYYDSIAVGIILTIMISNCTFTSNNLITVNLNHLIMVALVQLLLQMSTLRSGVAHLLFQIT